jgi:hypothetical protein
MRGAARASLQLTGDEDRSPARRAGVGFEEPCGRARPLACVLAQQVDQE